MACVWIQGESQADGEKRGGQYRGYIILETLKVAEVWAAGTVRVTLVNMAFCTVERRLEWLDEHKWPREQGMWELSGREEQEKGLESSRSRVLLHRLRTVHVMVRRASFFEIFEHIQPRACERKLKPMSGRSVGR